MVAQRGFKVILVVLGSFLLPCPAYSASNPNCCDFHRSPGTCYEKYTMGVRAGWDCIEPKADPVAGRVTIQDCFQFNQALALFGDSECASGRIHADTSTCQKTGDRCFVDSKFKSIKRSGTLPAVCEKAEAGHTLERTGYSEPTSKQVIIQGQCNDQSDSQF